MKDYSVFTNDELVVMISGGEQDALGQLFANIRPAIIKQANKYLEIITIFSMDDFLQEGYILAWKTIKENRFRSGSFFPYFFSSLKNRFAFLARDYALKHPLVEASIIEAPEQEAQISILVESDFVKEYREKHRQECREYYRRKKEKEAEKRRAAGIPDPVKLTESEKREAKRKKCLDYYYRNREELNRKKREKRKAAKLAAASEIS